jgi:hypothetical protein
MPRTERAAENRAISEASLFAWLKKAESELGRRLHIRRIENLVGVGDADVSGVFDGLYFDIELKTADRPARDSTVILNSNRNYVRAEQKVWHRTRWMAGGNNFVLLQVGSGKGADLYLFRGDMLYNLGIEDKTEEELRAMSIAHPQASQVHIIARAASYRSALNI